MLLFIHRSEAVIKRVLQKRPVSKNLAIFTGKHLRWSPVLTNLQAFSCEYCKVFKNTYFEKHQRMTASRYHLLQWPALSLRSII